MEPTYEEIGRLVAEDVRHDPEGAFLYAEVKRGMIACSIFKEVDDRVIYRQCSDELIDHLYETWQSIASRKRWASISYTIGDGSFSAEFQFPEDWIKDEGFSDRRPRILAAKYGNKKIDYSDP